MQKLIETEKGYFNHRNRDKKTNTAKVKRNRKRFDAITDTETEKGLMA
jgi:hypothetical protein